MKKSSFPNRGNIPVSECYVALQGECIHSGQPTLFIRTYGCNLRCAYCDSKYAIEGDDFKWMSIPEILKEVKKHPEIKLIELTGGEPLQMLPEINELIGVLTDAAYYVDIETNGSLPLPPLGDYSLRHVSIIMDVKTPSSKMHKTTNLNHLKNLREQDAVKYVISNKEDLDYSFKIYKKYPTKASSWFSPCWGTIEPRVVAEAILESKLPIFMSLQLHKIMYPPDQRGV